METKNSTRIDNFYLSSKRTNKESHASHDAEIITSGSGDETVLLSGWDEIIAKKGQDNR